MSEALREWKICLSCNLWRGHERTRIFKYVDEHSSSLNPMYDFEGFYCTHAGHTWMPVKSILTVLKIDPSTYERNFLNPHQLFDDTHYNSYQCSHVDDM